jgi:thiamine-monophosphate kinase
METFLTPIDQIGEFGLIDHIQKDNAFSLPSTIKAIGDDAAVVKSEGEVSLISTDSYVEGVHFDLVYTPLQHLGYKCIAATVSDIYAMNGMATHVVIAIALSSKYTLEALDEIYKGIHHACKTYNVDLVGGDTTSSRSGMAITVTALGHAAKGEVVYRSGAGEDDLLVVTGDLGGAYIGLQVLEREKRVFLERPDFKPDLSGFDYVLRRQLRPEARWRIISIT